MTRSKRMQPVVDVATRREREAAARLGEWQRRLEFTEQRLQELQQYRDDYTAQFAGGGSLSAARLQDYRVFLDRLNQAIEQQRALIERTRQDCEAQRRRWIDVHGRVQALAKVVSRYRGEERASADKHEQKEMDQHALNSHLRDRDD